MTRLRDATRSALTVTLALAAGASAGCGGDDEPGGPATTTLPRTITTSTSTTTGPEAGRPASSPGLRKDLVVGIGEQLPQMFAEPSFRALGIDHARLVVAYDAALVAFERQIVDAWLLQASRAGVEPFVTFQHSRVHPRRLPSVAEFRADFRAFRKRYPQVRVYAPWNEINHASQPTSRAPARAAEFYDVVRSECGDCTVLAGDVLDQPGMMRYLAAYRRRLDGAPRIWGLHNYADANRFRRSGLRTLLRSVRGDVWLTETGGLVQFGRSFPRSERRAARALDFVLGLAADTPGVKRVYLYNWTGSKPGARFDAGLVGPDRKPRPAYGVLRGALKG
jgi:polysaccharide biosynthesis protein PslG